MKRTEVHITEGKVNRTLCRRDTLRVAGPVITVEPYLQRRAISAERLKVCRDCTRAVRRFVATV